MPQKAREAFRASRGDINGEEESERARERERERAGSFVDKAANYSPCRDDDGDHDRCRSASRLCRAWDGGEVSHREGKTSRDLSGLHASAS